MPYVTGLFLAIEITAEQQHAQHHPQVVHNMIQKYSRYQAHQALQQVDLLANFINFHLNGSPVCGEYLARQSGAKRARGLC
jgi:hypothetical protein